MISAIFHNLGISLIIWASIFVFGSMISFMFFLNVNDMLQSTIKWGALFFAVVFFLLSFPSGI